MRPLMTVSARAARSISRASRMVERIEAMEAVHDLGEALGHDLLIDGIDAARALGILDRIDAALAG